MSLQIFIGDDELEKSDKTRVGVTFQANSLNDLSTRQGNTTNVFKLPKTQRNKTLLQNADDLNSSTNIPYQKNYAKLIQDGIELIPEGVIFFNDVNEFLNINVVGGIVTFYDRVKGLKLSDLDLTDLNHNYDYATVTGSYANVSGYIYAAIQWMKKGATSNNAYQPMVFYKTLVERICMLAGYELRGNILTNYYYLNTLLSTDFRMESDWVDLNSVHIIKNTSEAYVGRILISTATVTDNVVGYHFQNSGNFVGQIYTATEQVTINFSVDATTSFSAFNTFTNSLKEYRAEMVNLTTSAIIAVDSYVFNAGERADIEAGIPVVVNSILVSGFVNLAPGDQIQIRQVGVTDSIGGIAWAELNVSSVDVDAKDIYYPYLGGAIDFAKIQHDMLIKDFFKGFLNQFAIIGEVNENTKVITLNTFQSIADNLGSAIDWSNKYDPMQSGSAVLRYQNNSYAKKNYLKYKTESDVQDEYNYSSSIFEPIFGSKLPELYGSGFITVADENLEDEKTIVDLPFAASIKNYIPFVNNDYSVDKFTPRCMVLRSRDNFPTSNTCTFFDPSYIRNLAFSHFSPNSDNLKKVFYTTLENVLVKYKEIELPFKINAIDVQNINYSIPVYLDIHIKGVNVNGYFYINIINNFVKGKSTIVQLVRL